MLRFTPFHARTSALCEGQNWRRWAGYLVAGSYELTHEREYWAIRNAAALLDVSPLYKYLVRGPDAVRLLNRIVTRNISKCAIGQVMYTPWCDDYGKVIDDGTVSRLDAQTFRVTSADPNYLWFRENAFGMDVTIDDVSSQLGALALQGPNARKILNQLADQPLDGLKYFRLTQRCLRNIPVTISRTGYTGDLGYELWVEPQHAEALWDALIEAGDPYGITPTGLLALDIARIEAGLILIETDYTSARHARIEGQKSSPFEINLGWTVNLDKENFIGKRALVQAQARGAVWQFVGLEIDWDSLESIYAAAGLHPAVAGPAWRASTPVYVGGQWVGYASSGCWSPILKKYIALAHVQAPHNTPGTDVMLEVTVEHKRQQAVARVVKTPFLELERKKG
jgi:aminomethyltransferase